MPPDAGKHGHAVLVRISPGYPPVAGGLHTRYAPVRRSPAGHCCPLLPLDLHVLSLPLAFILSQDQTLHCTIVSNSLSVLCARFPLHSKERPRFRPPPPGAGPSSYLLYSVLSLLLRLQYLNELGPPVPRQDQASPASPMRVPPSPARVPSPAGSQTPRGESGCKSTTFSLSRKTFSNFFQKKIHHGNYPSHSLDIRFSRNTALPARKNDLPGKNRGTSGIPPPRGRTYGPSHSRPCPIIS